MYTKELTKESIEKLKKVSPIPIMKRKCFVLDNEVTKEDFFKLAVFKLSDKISDEVYEFITEQLNKGVYQISSLKTDLRDIQEAVDNGDREAEEWFSVFNDYLSYYFNTVRDSIAYHDNYTVVCIPYDIILTDRTENDKYKKLVELWNKTVLIPEDA